MRTRSGMSLVEVLASVSLLVMTIGGVVSLTIGGLRSAAGTSLGVDLSEGNARSLRRVTERLRQAMAVTILEDGRRIQFQMPTYSGTADPITGEREILDPLIWDGVNHEYRVVGGELVDEAGKTLVKRVVLVDPDPNSSGYNQSYAPFQLGTVGSARSITVTLMTRASTTSGTPKFWRLKNTVLLRNAR